jgi:hypothetical protein
MVDQFVVVQTTGQSNESKRRSNVEPYNHWLDVKTQQLMN